MHIKKKCNSDFVVNYFPNFFPVQSPLIPEHRPPDIHIIEEDAELHNNNTDTHLLGDSLMDVDMEVQSASGLNNHVEPNRTDKHTANSGQNANSRTRLRGGSVGGDMLAGNGRLSNADIQEYNANLKKAAIKEVRKPGKGKKEIYLAGP